MRADTLRQAYHSIGRLLFSAVPFFVVLLIALQSVPLSAGSWPQKKRTTYLHTGKGMGRTMGDILTLENNRPRGWLILSTDDIKERCLSGAIWANNCVLFVLLHFKVDAGQHLQARKILMYISCLQNVL